jgi:hypothetical protein
MELAHPTPILSAGTIEPFSDFLASQPKIEELLAAQASVRVADIVRVLALIRGMDIDTTSAA